MYHTVCLRQPVPFFLFFQKMVISSTLLELNLIRLSDDYVYPGLLYNNYFRSSPGVGSFIIPFVSELCYRIPCRLSQHKSGVFGKAAGEPVLYAILRTVHMMAMHRAENKPTQPSGLQGLQCIQRVPYRICRLLQERLLIIGE
jgi:hypothetical protein